MIGTYQARTLYGWEPTELETYEATRQCGYGPISVGAKGHMELETYEVSSL